MDSPGLVSGESTSKEAVELSAGSEWRFEVPFDSKLMIKLTEGIAEIFGTEIAIGAELTFSGYKAAVYTPYGCKLEWWWSGNDNITEYSSDETPMTVYTNFSFALETMRRHYQQGKAGSSCPNVLVLGPDDSGKTSLCKILCSYANKTDRFPLYVNLDPREGVYAPPGSLTASPISDILDVQSGWGESQATGATLFHPKQPLVYTYGLENCLTNVKFYKHLLAKIAAAANDRLSNDNTVRNSGMIIDTPGTSFMDKAEGHAIINTVVSDFDVNVIAVVGHERLYAEMQKKFKTQTNSGAIKIVKLPSSGGCVEREDTFLRAVQRQSIREYFYGSLRQPLAPKTITVDYSMVTVYRVAENSSINNVLSVLPIGLESSSTDENVSSSDIDGTGTDAEKTIENDDYLIKLETSSILQNCVMAVLNADVDDPPSVLINAETLGYVHVVDADDSRHKLKVLMAVPGKLPSRPFLVGDYRYHE